MHTNNSDQNTFKITANGFIKICRGGVISTYFYRPGAENDLIKDGYRQLF